MHQARVPATACSDMSNCMPVARTLASPSAASCCFACARLPCRDVVSLLVEAPEPAGLALAAEMYGPSMGAAAGQGRGAAHACVGLLPCTRGPWAPLPAQGTSWGQHDYELRPQTAWFRQLPTADLPGKTPLPRACMPPCPPRPPCTLHHADVYQRALILDGMAAAASEISKPGSALPPLPGLHKQPPKQLSGPAAERAAAAAAAAAGLTPEQQRLLTTTADGSERVGRVTRLASRSLAAAARQRGGMGELTRINRWGPFLHLGSGRVPAGSAAHAAGRRRAAAGLQAGSRSLPTRTAQPAAAAPAAGSLPLRSSGPRRCSSTATSRSTALTCWERTTSFWASCWSR